tara:strand:- start:1050 stop:2192 length:1143 start_codon:yes stop_codon:yes gene_type:complete
MKHILLICHKDHLISGSIQFIKNLLENHFTVDVVTDNMSLQHIKPLFKTHANAVIVLWQTEYLAPWLLSKGLKVVTFLMYDGCGTAPKSYFKILDRTYLFNFSKKLHKICINAGVTSHELNYFPKVQDLKSERVMEDKLFYWLRRPNSSLSESVITDVFSPYISKIHIHDRQDNHDVQHDIIRIPDDFVSTSIWFDNKEELKELIVSSKYYLAPRESEGIGMAFLEAMSLGCIVFANKNSTHDQYIYHGYNGFLIDFESRNTSLIKQQIKEAFEIIKIKPEIGENARNYMIKGQQTWKDQSEKLIQVIQVILEAEKSKSFGWIEQIAGYQLIKLYKRHHRLYFIASDIYLKLGLFNDKVIRIRMGMFVNLAFRFLKIFKR